MCFFFINLQKQPSGMSPCSPKVPSKIPGKAIGEAVTTKMRHKAAKRIKIHIILEVIIQ